MSEKNTDNTRSGSFVPAEALSLAFPEPGLEFFGSTLRVDAVDDAKDGSTTYTLTSDHQPLTGVGLFNLMQEVAPVKGDSYLGVIGDWEVPDNVGKPGTYTSDLMNLHARLGGAWTEFEESRPALLRLMRQAHEPQLGVERSSKYPVIDAASISIGRVARDVGVLDGAEGVDALVRLTQGAGIEYADEVVHDGLLTALTKLGRLKSPISNPRTVEERYGSASGRNRGEIILNVLRGLPEEVRAVIPELAKAKVYQEIPTEEGNLYYIPPHYTGYLPDDTLPDEQTVGSGRSILQAMWSNKLERETALLPKRLESLASDTIEPLLQWRTDEAGTRDFVLDRTVSHGTNHTHFEDGVVGVLLAAYMEPEIRSTWPERIPVGGAKVLKDGQNIGVEQVPVLALMPRARHQLLSGEFIGTAERSTE